MRWLVRLVIASVLAFALFMGAVMLASDFGGEVVSLTTMDSEGLEKVTKLWVVDDHGQIWLRAGQPGSSWLLRLEAEPMVDLERNGVKAHYRAVVVPKQRDRINRLMAERYGFADTLIGVMRSDQETTAIRLDPAR